MKKFLICLCATALLTACHKSDDGPDEPVVAERTVLVYMSGENNLTSFAESDISEMTEGIKSVSGQNNLVVFVDRASKTETPFIARIRNDKKQPVDTLYKYAQDFYCSDPDNFREVITRTVGLCPAKSYGLVLWGHANGWIIENSTQSATAPRRAYGIDNGDNTSASRWTQPSLWLDIPDMRKAMEQLPFKWKFIFSDCCNMQNAELAYELRNVAEYLIASPAEITGVGAPYNTIVKDFFYSNDEDMYQGICDDYYAQVTHEMKAGDEHLPISVVKTSEMEALAAATQAILPQIAEYIAQSGAMDGIVYYFNYVSGRPARERVMYDMQSVIMKALETNPTTYQQWYAAFTKAVIYVRKSVYWHANCVNFDTFTTTEDEQGVMSMFFPLSQYESTLYKYNELMKQLQWYQAVGWSSVGW